MVKLARPTFVTGARDDLAAADIYARNTGTVINKIQSLSVMADVDLSAMLRGGDFLSRQLPVIGSLNGVLSFNKDNLAARLSLGGKGVLSAVRNMSGGLAANISARIPGGGEVFASIGGVVGRVQATALGSIGDLGRMVSDITGSAGIFSVIDKDATVGLYSGLISEATRFGVPNTFDALMGSVTDPYILNRVAGSILPTIVAKADLGALGSIALRVSAGSVPMAYPGVLSTFSSGYRNPPRTSSQQYRENYDQTFQTYDRVQPGWNQQQRRTSSGTSTALNLTAIVGGSGDFKAMVSIGAKLASGGSQNKLYALASLFKPTTVDQQLRQTFPRTVLGASQRSRSQVYDPRSFVPVEQGFVVS